MTRRVIFISILILVGGAAGNYFRFMEAIPDHGPDFGMIPMTQTAYSGEERRFSEESYEILQADTSTLRLYVGDDANPIWLFIGYFSSQKYGSQIHSPKHCLPGSGWKILSQEPYQLQLSSTAGRLINRLVIDNRGRQQLMLYWYETRSGTIRNEFGLKWDLMLNSLQVRPTDAAIVRVNLPLNSDESIDDATARALTFLEQFLPTIDQALPFGS